MDCTYKQLFNNAARRRIARKINKKLPVATAIFNKSEPLSGQFEVDGSKYYAVGGAFYKLKKPMPQNTNDPNEIAKYVSTSQAGGDMFLTRPAVAVIVGVMNYARGVHEGHAIAAFKYNKTLFTFNAWGKDAAPVDKEIFKKMKDAYGCEKVLTYRGPNLQIGNSVGLCVAYASNFLGEIANSAILNVIPNDVSQAQYNTLVHTALTTRGTMFENLKKSLLSLKSINKFSPAEYNEYLAIKAWWNGLQKGQRDAMKKRLSPGVLSGAYAAYKLSFTGIKYATKSKFEEILKMCIKGSCSKKK